MPANNKNTKIQSQSQKREKMSPRKEKFKKDLRQWAIFSFIYVPVMAIIAGTVSIYYPDPLPLIWGLYFDAGLAITSIAIPFYLALTGLIFVK